MLDGPGVGLAALALRRHRHGHRVPLRLDHAVLHREPLPPRAVHRRGLAHRPRHQHHQRPRRRHGNPGDARRRHQRRAAAQLLLRRSRASTATSPASPTTPRASTAPPSPPWACSPAPPTSWRWTPSAPSPTTPAASSRCPTSPIASATKTDKLDSAGNTTKALTKGYAIGSASLAAFLLFSAYLEEIQHHRHSHKMARAQAAGIAASMPDGWTFTNINLASVPVFVGALLGAMLVYLFSSLAIKRRRRTAQMVVKDVRDQFRENPGIMAGTYKPDYGRCVSIVTGAALKEMVLPGVLAVACPCGRRHLPPLQLRLRSHRHHHRRPRQRPHHRRCPRQSRRRRSRRRHCSWSAPSPASCWPC